MDIYEETKGLNVNKKVLHSYCGYMKEGHHGGVIQDAISMLG